MESYKTLFRLYQILVLGALFALTLRIYASPQGATEIHSWLRAPADRFLSSIHIDEILWYLNWTLAVMGAMNIVAGIFLIRTDARRIHFQGFVLNLLAFALPVFQFGYGMAHTDSNRIFAYSLGWFVTAALWAGHGILVDPGLRNSNPARMGDASQTK